MGQDIPEPDIFLLPVSFYWKWHVVPAWTSGAYEHFLDLKDEE